MKRITTQNWLEPDSPGAQAGTHPSVWRDAFLSIHLDRGVPVEVTTLFETARASALYGLFFAPLVGLGVEQCYRALETGIRVRCAQAGLPVSLQDRQGRRHALSFSHNLRQLQDRALIPPADVALWQQVGELKNWLAALRHTDAMAREHAVTALSRAAGLLNGLFA